jgi:hypothetical protein
MLIGGIRHIVYRTLNGRDFAIWFRAPADCMAVWRALRIVPFEGRLLDVEAVAAPLGPVRQPVQNSVVVEPTIVVETAKAEKIEFTKPIIEWHCEG